GTQSLRKGQELNTSKLLHSRKLPNQRAHQAQSRSAAYIFLKQAAAGFIQSMPMDPIEKSLLAEPESLMASSSILKPDTFTGRIWACRTKTTVRSSASISTVKIA